jgi:tRNA threonylcarbamoyl adenosine modification protein (Sua5/YciO/YrdC/YwlC family)
MTDIGPALAALRRGEVIGLPTDTVYGIAADPMQRSAVERLFVAKDRPEIKPIPILAASIEDVRRVAVIDDDVSAIAGRHWPGGLTLILPRAPAVPDWVGDPGRNTVGVRIPDHPVALEVLTAAGPLAVTSANRSSEKPAIDAAGAAESLGDSIAVYLPGVAGGGESSTIVDLSGHEPRILRHGPVEWVTL